MYIMNRHFVKIIKGYTKTDISAYWILLSLTFIIRLMHSIT